MVPIEIKKEELICMNREEKEGDYKYVFPNDVDKKIRRALAVFHPEGGGWCWGVFVFRSKEKGWSIIASNLDTTYELQSVDGYGDTFEIAMFSFIISLNVRIDEYMLKIQARRLSYRKSI